MTDFTLATAITSFIILGFTSMPFSVLIYSMLAVTVNSWEDWAAMTLLMIVAQLIYSFRRVTDG